ncbi:hypothetical protein SKTS_24110 [Sulfurimicrobium lacus]|uniref:Lipoprotein n=1 Tax=Sulfurimicrobium lacus TaxID=2715678 RepID=A0A6F8VFI6_9PROT|nr:hypothetical protein [Sulfurimicrobium lacus]BCB27525.1 hypothetical protein SKTS_24110 [Sulfurimicrobium lacus]
MNARHRLTRAVALSLLLAVFPLSACHSIPTQQQRDGRELAFARAKAGEALFEEKCRTVVGEKIYRTVPDVDGVLLMKLRPQASENEWADPMWPGAAFALESTGDEYINTFLGYEHSSSAVGKHVTKEYRGYIGTGFQPDNPDNLPGYRYVDVIDPKDGLRYRYTGSQKAVRKKDTGAPDVQREMRNNPNYDLNVYSWVLDETLTQSPAPRYAVTFEDHVIPEEREVGVASSTVKVIDTRTGEVLGEMLRYAWTHRGAGPKGRAAWLSAYKCPGHAVGADAATRKFVDQILIPKKEK